MEVKIKVEELYPRINKKEVVTHWVPQLIFHLLSRIICNSKSLSCIKAELILKIIFISPSKSSSNLPNISIRSWHKV